MKELDDWEETMSVLMQSRASFSNGKAVGLGGISAGDSQDNAMESTAENQECL